MSETHEMLADGSLSLLAMLVPLAVPGFGRLSAAARAALMMFVLLAGWAPLWHGKPALFYVRGVVGELSVASLVLFALQAARGLGVRTSYTARMSRDVAALLFLLFAILYSCTLGYLHYDLYAWGYEPRELLVLAAIMLAYLWVRHPGAALAWLLALFAFACGLQASPNLWDALGDPILWLGTAWHAFAPAPAQGRMLAAA
jgi:hypothetical protein